MYIKAESEGVVDHTHQSLVDCESADSPLSEETGKMKSVVVVQDRTCSERKPWEKMEMEDNDSGGGCGSPHCHGNSGEP